MTFLGGAHRRLRSPNRRRHPQLPARVILLSGPISAGKTTLATGLSERYGVHSVKTGQLLRQRLPRLRETRGALQRAGEQLATETQIQWLPHAIIRFPSSTAYNLGISVASS